MNSPMHKHLLNRFGFQIGIQKLQDCLECVNGVLPF